MSGILGINSQNGSAIKFGSGLHEVELAFYNIMRDYEIIRYYERL
jgi:hypothetical protein